MAIENNSKNHTVLVTGGCGYIGSFTVLELLKEGYKVIVLDNLYNSSPVALERVALLSREPKVKLYEISVTDKEGVKNVFLENSDISSVIHFAGLKAVGESGEIPLDYFTVNVEGAVNLLNAAEKYGNNVKNFVISSSATVYGDVTRFSTNDNKNMYIPIPEHCPLQPTNPYGHTKASLEWLTADFINAVNKKKQKDNGIPIRAAILRYFNPVGAHPSGIMGEDPQGIPFNLLPLLSLVATGQRPFLSIFGDDYDSKDGTAIRDYIHVIDLAKGHISALKYIDSIPNSTNEINHNTNKQIDYVKYWNLGTGKGSTVYDILHAFNKVVGRELPYKVLPRRDGDVLNLTADPTLANKELSWTTERTLEDAITDLWKWVKNNPKGYRQSFPRALHPG